LLKIRHNSDTFEWTVAYVAGTSPAARSRHTMTLVGTKMYVLGGGDDARVYNDVYALDTGTSLSSMSFLMPFCCLMSIW
jgi:hypothetical protein